MQIKLSYTNDGKLEDLIRDKKIIPHKVMPREKFIVGEKYYDGFSRYIYKVLSVEYNEDGTFEGVQIKTDEGNYCWIASELDPSSDYYITYDIYNICNIEIINNKHIYSGAEIRYWFFINNITVMNRKYACFWPYIDPTNPGSIDDAFTYILSASTDEYGNYIKPRIVRMFPKENRSNIKAKEYWEKLELRDKVRQNARRKKESPRG